MKRKKPAKLTDLSKVKAYHIRIATFPFLTDQGYLTESPQGISIQFCDTAVTREK